jgi:hypothetical protein
VYLAGHAEGEQGAVIARRIEAGLIDDVKLLYQNGEQGVILQVAFQFP